MITHTTYFTNDNDDLLCADCGQEIGTDSLQEHTNDTGHTLTCTSCGDDIAFVGQVYRGRADWHALQCEFGGDDGLPPAASMGDVGLPELIDIDAALAEYVSE
jgi:hypothetical protein